MRIDQLDEKVTTFMIDVEKRFANIRVILVIIGVVVALSAPQDSAIGRIILSIVPLA